jgi:L-fuconolactonase
MIRPIDENMLVDDLIEKFTAEILMFMRRVDAHQHFWQLSRGDYTWLTPTLDLLYRDYTAADLQPLLAAAGVDKTVLVQAAASVAETEFMLRVAEASGFVAGVVGWVDMESQQLDNTLQRLGENPLLVGIRPMIQDIADPQWMLKSELAPAFYTLVDMGLTFDALVTPQHLDALLMLLRRYPDLKVVIDHGAKPSIATGALDSWAKQISRLATETQAYCKLSGLMTEAGNQPMLDCLLPYMETLVEQFGAERVMWGSDWPVLNMAAGYGDWIGISEAFIGRLSPDEQAAIWAGSAERFYGL